MVLIGMAAPTHLVWKTSQVQLRGHAWSIPGKQKLRKTDTNPGPAAYYVPKLTSQNLIQWV